MPQPQHVYICPSCRHYLPADDVDEDDGKPVCTTDGCDREGEILNLMWMCPACKKCFSSQQQVKEHGQDAHDL